jgi:hypothetical protein
VQWLPSSTYCILSADPDEQQWPCFNAAAVAAAYAQVLQTAAALHYHLLLP